MVFRPKFSSVGCCPGNKRSAYYETNGKQKYALKTVHEIKKNVYELNCKSKKSSQIFEVISCMCKNNPRTLENHEFGKVLWIWKSLRMWITFIDLEKIHILKIVHEIEKSSEVWKNVTLKNSWIRKNVHEFKNKNENKNK